MPELSVEIHGTRFANPVLAASGTFGYGTEHAGLVDLSELGGFVTKGLSPQPKKGNPAPRIWETTAGMLNSIGLENVGVDGFVKDKLPELTGCPTRVVVNFFGNDEDQYIECARKLDPLAPVDALEMNLSCPNVKAGGIHFGTDAESAARLVTGCKKVTSKPLWVKLSPLSHGLVPIAEACAKAGADAFTLVNTIPGVAIDPVARKPRLGAVQGGLSGPAIKPAALRAVLDVHRADLGVPIVGVGGISSGSDVVEFLLAGASLVQVGTMNLVEPNACIRIRDELVEFMDLHGISTVKELTGALKLA
jgi:dihydroorotate dehydrogenase (NAD+) catalytic subunit